MKNKAKLVENTAKLAGNYNRMNSPNLFIKSPKEEHKYKNFWAYINQIHYTKNKVLRKKKNISIVMK